MLQEPQIDNIVSIPDQNYADLLRKIGNQSGSINEFHKSEIIQTFLASDKIEQITPDQISEIIKQSGLKNERLKLSVIQTFLTSDKRENITPDQISEIIKQSGLTDESYKSKIIEVFLVSNKRENITPDQISEIIKQSGPTNEFHKSKIIQTFLASYKIEQITPDQISEIIIKSGLTDEFHKSKIIEVFLASDKRENITPDQVFSMIEKNRINSKNGANLIIAFLASDKRENIIPDQVFSMIGRINFPDPSSIEASDDAKEYLIREIENIKSKMIEAFLSSDKRDNLDSEQVISMIEQANIQNETNKSKIIQAFLVNNKIDSLNLESVNDIMNKLDIKDQKLKCNLLEDFFKSKNGGNFTTEDFVTIIKEVGFQYQVNKTIELYKNKFSSSEKYIENFFNIVTELNPSETMQCKFLEEFIKQNSVIRVNLEHLKPFIKELKDDENVILILDTLNAQRMLTNEKDILDLLGGRVRKQYSFLTEIVDGKNLEECLSPAGINSLRATFGQDLKIGDNPITISDLFAYYDFKNQTSALSTMLKPEFKKQLRDNFAPSAEKLLYKPQELDKLNQLLGNRGVSFDVKNHLLENTKLCDYLKEKVGNVEEISASKTYQINFTNFGIEEGKQAEINTLFNKLLKSPNPDKEEVAKFFIDLLQIELPEGEDKKNQLAVFFKNNKKEIAHCFCNFNLKKEDFNSALTSLKDGCYANIEMQFKNMLYGMMIKDEEAQILYAVAGTHIFSAIANEQDITHHGSSVNNSIIKSYFLSPIRLIEKLSQEETLKIGKASEIIKSNIGSDGFEILQQRLQEKCEEMSLEEGGKFLNQKAKEIASYFIVKKSFGEEKMRDLEEKNPQLKELGDLIYNRAPEASPRNLQQRDPDAPRVSCLFSCLRRQPS